MIIADWQHEARLTGGRPVLSATEAIGLIAGPGAMFVGSGAATPQALLRALVEQSERLAGSVLHHIILLDDAIFADPRFTTAFRHQAYFLGHHERPLVQRGVADAVPIHFHELGRAFRSGRIPLDVALIQVSLPDAEGRFSYGSAVDFVKPAVESARLVIAEVNPYQPWVHGDAHLTAEQVTAFVPVMQPLQEMRHPDPDPVALQIGRHVAELIDDGDTIQIGFGILPDAVAGALAQHRDLGLHTEMFSDGTLALIEAGAITGARKTLHPGLHVGAFVLGSRRVYEAVRENPAYEFHAVEYVNDPLVIGQNDQLAAINAALAIDLTGQVCADSLGTRIYSGVGGQADFMRGASRSRGGKPIICLRSTAKDGTISRIVPTLPAGSGVTTSRFDVHWVVTEHGAVNLHGMSYRERAVALAEIADPAFREALEGV
ncbi:MAG: acetyl-CoA hydrolase/transferase C-terminal domain-containing protein [bacterium]